MDASTGQCRWSTHRLSRRTEYDVEPSRESYPDDTGIIPKKHCRGKAASTQILGLDLNSGLGLKGAREQVEEPFVGRNTTGVNRSWQDTRWKACFGTRTVPRSQQCTRNLNQRTPHHKALRARWITGWGLREFITLLKIVRVLWKTGCRLQIIQAGLGRDHMPNLCDPALLHCSPREERQQQHNPKALGNCKRIADCLQIGRQSNGFFCEWLTNHLRKAKPKFESSRVNPTPDAHWALLVDWHEGTRPEPSSAGTAYP